MAFSERFQQLCPAVSNEQATELREFLVEASERLKSEPALMASSLKTLEQEATDQGYDWDSVVMVLQQLAKASSAGDEQEQLMTAWQTCTSSEGSIADFTAVLSDRFPEIYSTFRELVEMAREEHAALSGVAGGTSSWRIDPSRTSSQKKKARHKDYIEAGIAAAGVAGVSWVVNSAINEHKLGKSTKQLLTIAHDQNGRQFWDTKKMSEALSGSVCAEIRKNMNYVLAGERDGNVDMTLEKRFYVYTSSLQFDSKWTAVKYQLKKMSPLYHYFRAKRAEEPPENNGHENDNEVVQTSMSGELESMSSELDSVSIDPRRMRDRIDNSLEDLQDENNGISSLKDDSDISLSDFSESGKILPGGSSELWNSAKSFKGIAMSDLTGDMQYAEKNFARSISSDISGIEDKEFNSLEDL